MTLVLALVLDLVLVLALSASAILSYNSFIRAYIIRKNLFKAAIFATFGGFPSASFLSI